MDVHFLPAFFLSFPSFSLALLFSTRLLLSSVFSPVVLSLLSLHTLQEFPSGEIENINLGADAILPKIVLPTETNVRNRIIGGWVYRTSRSRKMVRDIGGTGRLEFS